MSNVTENRFITPNHDLDINFTYDTLWIHTKLQKGKILSTFYLLAPIIAFPVGLFAIFISPTNENTLNFSFTTNKIITVEMLSQENIKKSKSRISLFNIFGK